MQTQSFCVRYWTDITEKLINERGNYMDILTLITGALLVASGFAVGVNIFEHSEKDDGCRELYQREYAKNNGLYEARKR